ncbi:MAG: hypothetical protein JW862_18170, partial [Anaerolineales bacterium]|nr:hypothetical protein [Anaerolineales bacterium]
CKGCKAECPSNVDVARLKYEFLHYYYQQAGHRHRWRDYLFGYIDRFAHLGQPFGQLANWGLRQGWVRGLFSKAFGLAPERKLPTFAERPFRAPAVQLACPGSTIEQRLVFLLLDTFSEHFYPAAAWHSLYALQQAGFQVTVLPLHGAGRTLISKGLLLAARAHAERLIAAIKAVDPEGHLPVIGIEPSEIFTLSDEYPDFFPTDTYVQLLAQRAWMIDEFLVRHGQITAQPDRPPVLLHGHCYQKARPPAADGMPVGVAATVAMLAQAGYPVEVVDAGCCGMAGAFGYEVEHYSLSLQVGEQRLFPAVRAASPQVIVAAAGVSCQAQIEDGTQRQAVHPITLI